jgi:hypothetical protein
MSQLYQTMEEDDSTLLQYLIAEDQPNYELLFDDDEEMAIMAAAMCLRSILVHLAISLPSTFARI